MTSVGVLHRITGQIHPDLDVIFGLFRINSGADTFRCTDNRFVANAFTGEWNCTSA